jgi:uncharacterized protein
MLEVECPAGLARVHLHDADRARAGLLLGHGAGGGVEAPDLVAAKDAALAEAVSVGLVEQPYRVAGRRSPASASQLDAAWMAVAARFREQELRGLPLLVGGRSLGARVACRTAGLTDAVGVVCLAFPLQPPRRSGAAPAPSRLPELDAVAVPTLVVQGTRDPFLVNSTLPRRRRRSARSRRVILSQPRRVTGAREYAQKNPKARRWFGGVRRPHW